MYINRKQFRTVLAIELVLVSFIMILSWSFWGSLCQEGWNNCVKLDDEYRHLKFILICIIRPFFFSPIMVTAFIGGHSFGSIEGAILTSLGAAISGIIIYLPAKYLGRWGVRPFISANLPATWQLLKTQDYKIIFITRWIPFFPFDLMSFIFGLGNFNLKRVFIFTFLGALPESFIFASLSSAPDSQLISEIVLNLVIFGILSSLPLLIFEFIFRKQGSSLWSQIKRMYYEILFEVQSKNEIVKKRTYDNKSTPVILLQGFFSSRRTLVILEKILTHKGYQVMSFNLGGSMGIFFTKGIRETAMFIDQKIRRQIDRHKFDKVHLVAHSKGGLVALYLILKFGGSEYVDKVVTLGTPFRGSKLTYWGLMTPLGFLWRDLWQMRPKSRLIKEIENGEPANVSIFCCYSDNDAVAKGSDGLLTFSNPNFRAIGVPMNHVHHFEFLYRRDVIANIAKLLSMNATEQPDIINLTDLNHPRLRASRRSRT